MSLAAVIVTTTQDTPPDFRVISKELLDSHEKNHELFFLKTPHCLSECELWIAIALPSIKMIWMVVTFMPSSDYILDAFEIERIVLSPSFL